MTAPDTDPPADGSHALTRRAFVGISAAATVSGSALALERPSEAQAAATLEVPEDDPAISIEHVTLDRSGLAVPAYAARPTESGPRTPSVVVIMHVWGVDTTIREAVRRLAKNGFAAIVPDLYAGFGAPSGDGATDVALFRSFAQRLDRAQNTGDARLAALWVAKRFPGTRTGVIGFCMGGRIALQTAIDASDAFSSVAAFYGPLTDVDPHLVRIPVCGSYGANDTSIPAESVRAFAASLKVPNDFRIYDNAGHAFCDDQRPSYVASAATDAWQRTISFLKKYLVQPS